MKVKAHLWATPRQDGTHAVKIYVYKNRKVTFLRTQVSVRPEDWKKTTGEVKKSNPMHRALNSALQKQIIEVTTYLLDGGDIEILQNKKKTKSGSLLEFIQTYIDEVGRGMHDIAPSTCRKYANTLKRLRQYCEEEGKNDFCFDDVSLDFYFSFCGFLSDHCHCNRPGMTNHIKNVKKFMNEALTRKLHNNTAHRDPAFKVFKHTTSNKIYLTESEIDRIAALDLSDQPALERERDRFLVSYYFILRYSDSIRVTRESCFQEKGYWYYRNVSKKTSRESIIPIKPAALDILRRRDFDLSGDSNQEANRKLKVIAAMANINQRVQQGEKIGPKSGFVSTHTARRSGATNLYLQGTSLKIIADLGGWENIETLRLYLRASGMESAKAARNLEFFK